MSVGEYYDCGLLEVISVIDAFYELETQRNAAEWERTRLLAFYSIKPHDTKKRIRKPSDLFSLSSDDFVKQKQTDSYKDRIEADILRQIALIEKWKSDGIIN